VMTVVGYIIGAKLAFTSNVKHSFPSRHGWCYIKKHSLNSWK
jgi:hypothetical protein